MEKSGEDEPVETTSACPDATSTAVGSPFCQMNGFALGISLHIYIFFHTGEQTVGGE